MKYIILILFLLLLPIQIYAQEENNKFGIHLAQPQDEDIDRAEKLVNSNGGTWGYITLVIQENDRDLNKWQGIFDKLRERRLIPIIRIATQGEGSNWRRPDSADTKGWVDFLNKLNWVVKERYIILFNEPNHASEWGGSVDPESFAMINEEFARQLKKASKDFFIMMGGLDASAPSARPNYEDEAIFLDEVIEEIGVEDFNRYFDGLSSHSYPNPGFVGSPYGSGKGTVRTYQWELQYLTAKGIKDLPVFITETGWNANALGRERIAEYFRTAYQDVWLPDPRIKAVTPFVLNYQTEPFLQFSWIKPQNAGEYPEFSVVQSMEKEEGRPDIRHSGRFIMDLPKEIVEDSTYHFQLTLQNSGQAIWSEDENYSLKLEGIDQAKYLISAIGQIKPFDSRTFDVYLTTRDQVGEIHTEFVLYRGDEAVLKSNPWTFTIVPLPALDFKVGLFPKVSTNSQHFEVQFFDEYEQLVFKISSLEVSKGKGRIEKVENIALGRKYRVVILKKNYLPRQTFVRFKKNNNEIKFESMLPLDFSGDGALNWQDFPSFFMTPQGIRNILPL
jgi:hypothetical protein